jgi:hypothetical protein
MLAIYFRPLGDVNYSKEKRFAKVQGVVRTRLRKNLAALRIRCPQGAPLITLNFDYLAI